MNSKPNKFAILSNDLGRISKEIKLMKDDFTFENITSTSVHINWHGKKLKSKGIRGLIFIGLAIESGVQPFTALANMSAESLHAVSFKCNKRNHAWTSS